MMILRGFILSLLLLPAVQAAEVPRAAWDDYDQAGDLARLAGNESESMRFQLLLSRLREREALWLPFADALEAFGQARYERLRPLVLERSVSELQQAVAAGRMTYTELATFYLYRIRAIETDPERYLNALIALDPTLLDQARAADWQRARGRVVASDSLFGMPVLLKDNIGAAGMPTTAGAVALRDNLAGDAFITARLRESGALILGKANLSEWAYFFCEDCPSGYSAQGGQTLNPYGRLQFGTGGSSSGSGAGVAASLAAVAVGTETSGSILSPASANSVVGLKPTTGALSRSGIVPISATLDTPGPLTRTVHDAVILFNAMAGFDTADTAMPLISDSLRLVYRQADITDWRLGALVQFLDNPLYEEALGLLSGAGSVIAEVMTPAVDTEGFGRLLGAEMVRDLALYLQQHGAGNLPIDSIASLRRFNEQDPALRAPYGQELVEMMDGLQLSEAEVEALRQRLQDAARQALDRLFVDNDLDVLLSINNRSAALAALANYPALTVPMGYEEDGRPMGLTLIAPSFAEQRLIDLGARFEALSQARRPPLSYQ
ncbi:MAG: amidase family protein [Pseudohongiellaceae bacterium]